MSGDKPKDAEPKKSPVKEIKVKKGDQVIINTKPGVHSGFLEIIIMRGDKRLSHDGKELAPDEKPPTLTADHTIAFTGEGGAKITTKGNFKVRPRLAINAPDMTLENHTVGVTIARESEKTLNVALSPVEATGMGWTQSLDKKTITLKTPDNKMKIDESKGRISLELEGTELLNNTVTKPHPGGRTLVIETGDTAKVQLVNPRDNNKLFHTINSGATPDKIIDDFMETRRTVMKQAKEDFRSKDALDASTLGMPKQIQNPRNPQKPIPLSSYVGKEIKIQTPDEKTSKAAITRKPKEKSKNMSLNDLSDTLRNSPLNALASLGDTMQEASERQFFTSLTPGVIVSGDTKQSSLQSPPPSGRGGKA